MDSSRQCSPFVEHSFRRLTRLIHQQDALSANAQQKTNSSVESGGPFDKGRSDRRDIDSRSMASQPRTYMRPPKTRLASDRSVHSPYSPSFTAEEPNPSLGVKPQALNFYQTKAELDRQQDPREKYDIPPPFERQWLRQPRYVPQERPNHGQNFQSQEQ